MSRIIASIWDGNKPLTDAKLLNIVGGLLESQVISGFGKNFNQVGFDTPDGEMLTRLTSDVWQFSAAKNYQQLRDMTLALKDADGNIRSFKDFKEAAAGIDAKFNDTWLKTEYNQAVGSATMAAKWTDFKKNASIMPYLRYSTVGDNRVRYEHAALNGIVRKLTDEFWRTHYPPNGWGCRCDVEQLATSVAKETEVIPNNPVPQLFKTNLAENGLIFPQGHAYYDGVPTEVLRNAVATLPKDAAFKHIYSNPETKGTVSVHLMHGIDEMKQNVITAKMLADKGYNVKLLPVLGENDDKLREYIYGTKKFIPGKNPDALINGKIADLKHPEAASKNAIHNAIRHGEKQTDFVIIHLTQDIDVNDINRYVMGKMKQSKINEVWVLDNKGELTKY